MTNQFPICDAQIKTFAMLKRLPRRPSTAPGRVTPLGRDQVVPSSPFFVVWLKYPMGLGGTASNGDNFTWGPIIGHSYFKTGLFLAIFGKCPWLKLGKNDRLNSKIGRNN